MQKDLGFSWVTHLRASFWTMSLKVVTSELTSYCWDFQMKSIDTLSKVDLGFILAWGLL